MAKQKREKEEEAYRRGYHQAIVESLHLVEAAVEQQVNPAYLFDVMTVWEKQLAAWSGEIDAADLLAPPPKPLTPYLRQVQREEEEDE